MDGKYEIREETPGGEGYIIDGVLRKGEIVKNKKPPEKLEDLAGQVFNPEAKQLNKEGMILVTEMPIWAKGGLIETAAKLNNPFERKALLEGAADARSKEVLLLSRSQGMITDQEINDRAVVDFEYFQGILRDRAENPHTVPYHANEDHMSFAAQLKLFADLTGEDRRQFMHATAETQARKNLGFDPGNPIPDELLLSRIYKEERYLHDALGARNYISNTVLRNKKA